MSRALLPPWHGAAEAALADVAATPPLPVPIPPLWDPASCPEALLAYLAWTLDAEDYDPATPLETRRAVIARAIEIHRKRGTRAGVLLALRAAGLGGAKIIERDGDKRHDGSLARDGGSDRAAADHWAEYRVILERPMSAAEAERARRVIARAAPARAHLKVLDFTNAPLIRDGTVPRDGTYTRGYA